MVDRNHLRKIDDLDLDDDDPFAELTRIMGHDPRPDASNDPFEIDLEKELMGDLDLGDEFASSNAPPAPPASTRDQWAAASTPDRQPTDAPEARANEADEGASVPVEDQSSAYAEPSAPTENDLPALEGFDAEFSAALDADLSTLQDDLASLEHEWPAQAGEPDFSKESEDATGEDYTPLQADHAIPETHAVAENHTSPETDFADDSAAPRAESKNSAGGDAYHATDEQPEGNTGTVVNSAASEFWKSEESDGGNSEPAQNSDADAETAELASIDLDFGAFDLDDEPHLEPDDAAETGASDSSVPSDGAGETGAGGLEEQLAALFSANRLNLNASEHDDEPGDASDTVDEVTAEQADLVADFADPVDVEDSAPSTVAESLERADDEAGAADDEVGAAEDVPAKPSWLRGTNPANVGAIISRVNFAAAPRPAPAHHFEQDEQAEPGVAAAADAEELDADEEASAFEHARQDGETETADAGVDQWQSPQPYETAIEDAEASPHAQSKHELSHDVPLQDDISEDELSDAGEADPFAALSQFSLGDLETTPVEEQTDETVAAFEVEEPDDPVSESQTEPASAVEADNTGDQVAADDMHTAVFDTPLVDTVELHEGPAAVDDDLDIPELSFEEDLPAVPMDDFEAEFADIFAAAPNESAPPEADVSLEETPPPARLDSDDERFLEEFMATTGVAAGAPNGSAGRGADVHTAPVAGLQQPNGPDLDDYDFESDMDQPLGLGAYEATEEQRKPPRRRGVMIAAIVAGVAIIGGVGAFAVSFGTGDDNAAPAVIKADSGPIKVKPENPGGTTVPNEGSDVYERVAGGEVAPAPEQERLVTTTEEPVDIAAPSVESRLVLPGAEEAVDDAGVEDESVAPVAGTEPDSTAKSEARIAAPDEDEAVGVGANNDLIAVAPRKVRTVTVRPDGTIVQAEPDETPAVATDIASTEPGADAQSLGPVADSANPAVTDETMAAPGDDAADSAASVDQDVAVFPGPSFPETVSVVPSRPNRSTAPAPAAANPPQQQASARSEPAAAATAPAAAAPSAGTSDWSMQIASQPSAESAQATYQDLAQRYASVIGGRGVSIVRAEIEGKGTYYRVRVPSASRDDAISLCSSYKAAGGSCFVSK